MSHILYSIPKNILIYVPDKKVHEELYFLKAVVPNEQQVKKYLNIKHDKSIKSYFDGFSTVEDAINKIKVDISKINYYVPLYDEYSKNLYIINRNNVYDRVIYRSYRFPTKSMIENFIKKKEEIGGKIKDIGLPKDIEKSLGEFKETTEVHYNIDASKYFVIREYRKLVLMLEFLKSFDIKTLEDTYVKVFYFYANKVGKDITVCKRPSFLPHFTHIKPYYTRSELINMALNMEKIKSSDKFYDHDDIMKLCKIVKDNDISAKTLLKHQLYIIKNDKIGIIQYYSLQGSFFINEYLRGRTDYIYKNELLEKSINAMYKLINNAPAFDKSYILYRFIMTDNHLKYLEIGDEYIPKSFVSTTRDPFYRSEVYKFGFILMKIKIPKEVKGVALCMETVSHFPKEEEILLSPNSILRLDKKNKGVSYYHTDINNETEITTMYEFTYMGKNPLILSNRPELKYKSEVLDLLELKHEKSYSIQERIIRFIEENVNSIYQFKTKIGDKSFTLITEWYNSMKVYENFYAAKSNNGFMIYTIVNDYINFTIELGEDSDGNYMYVNYYFRHSNTPNSKIIKDKDFLDFLSKLSYYFQVKYVILYTDYASCDNKASLENINEIYKAYYGGNYCVDFYDYLKYNKKRYAGISKNTKELTPKFDYNQLDSLKITDPLKILRKDDQDEIYHIYIKTYKPSVDSNKHNISDFYIHMIEKYCVYVPVYVDKMDRFFKNNNPFNNDYYLLDSPEYLYNRNLIPEIPKFPKSKLEPPKNKSEVMPKNKYRLDQEKDQRVPLSRSSIIEL